MKSKPIWTGKRLVARDEFTDAAELLRKERITALLHR